MFKGTNATKKYSAFNNMIKTSVANAIVKALDEYLKENGFIFSSH